MVDNFVRLNVKLFSAVPRETRYKSIVGCAKFRAFT